MLKKVSRMKKKGNFVRNVLTLITGTTIAQAIPIAISPILTRLYTPEEFGVYALYTSIVAILSIIATGRYELAVMLPVNDKQASNIVFISTGLTLFFSLFLLIFIVIFNNKITGILGYADIGYWLYFIPISVLIVGIYQTLTYWSNRKKKYKRIMSNRVIQSTTTGGLNVSLGLAGIGPAGLILSIIVGQTVSTIRYIFSIKKNKEITRDFISRKEIMMQAKKYSDFPKYSIVAHTTESMFGNLPVILMTSFFGSIVVGFYSLARRVIVTPISVVAGAIGDVFLQRASYYYNENGNCSTFFKKVFIILFSIGCIPFTILFFYSPQIFSFIFGEQWTEAGIYTRYLSIPFFLQFISGPLSNMFIIAQKQKLDLFIQTGVLLFGIVSLSIGYYVFNSAHIAIILFSVVLSIKYIILLGMSYRFAFNKMNDNK